MKIAILGTRGIPARYGGFETLAEELSSRLAARGHDVTVFTRPRYAQPGLTQWRGAKIRVLPTISTKYLDTVTHGFLSSLDALFSDYDAILFCNAINAPFCLPPRLAGQRVVLNVDGLERNRRKWNLAGRLAYRVAEVLSTLAPDIVVSDARVIRDYYREIYGAETIFIVVRAYRDVPGSLPLVVVGDAPYAKEYIAQVRTQADGRVLFPGAIYGEGYRQLLANAALYVQATEVGGTHPALVEALGFGRVVCYHDSPENKEVASGAALPFDVRRPADLAGLMTAVLDDPAAYSVWKERARERVAQKYRWNDVADRYAAVLEGKSVIP